MADNKFVQRTVSGPQKPQRRDFTREVGKYEVRRGDGNEQRSQPKVKDCHTGPEKPKRPVKVGEQRRVDEDGRPVPSAGSKKYTRL